MRIARSMGDFVNGSFTLPQNPVTGLGAFTRAAFTIPQNPFGMSGLGCGYPGSCSGGAACKQCAMGMGALDLSPSATSIGDSLGMSAVPNWMLYLGGAAVAYLAFFTGKGRRR